MTLRSLARRGFLGGAALTGLLSAAGRAAAAVLGYPRALEGPMVGPAGPGEIAVWVRASGRMPVTLEVSERRDFQGARTSAPVTAEADGDFCVTPRVDGLKPDTNYFYRLRFDGVLDRFAPLPFRTRTAPAGPADFRVAFGSCCRVQLDPDQPIFHTIALVEPDLFFWLGDNIYGDSDAASAHADLYRRQRVVRSALPLYRRVPQLAIWDDHDFGYNNAWGTNPAKAAILKTFRDYWPNPGAGSADAPGAFFKYAYGGIDFFFLDGRYHRDPPETPAGPAKTMLGAGQKAWLKRELLASRAPFKILICGVGWSSAEGPDGDSWAGYRHERDELFGFIRDRNIGGVVCLSGDQHIGELNCIPASEAGGYDIYDLVSSPLAQTMSDKWPEQTPEVRMRPVHSKSVNFGLLSFTWTPEPTLTFTLHDILGAEAWAPLVLKASELRNGVSTWKAKIDPKELKRRERG